MLNPCTEVWADHFQAEEDDRLQPRPSDPDALYTDFVYDLNDPRKVNLRRERRKRIGESLEVLSQGPTLVAFLLEASRRASGREAEALFTAAVSFERQMVSARSALERHAAVPPDAVDVCRCGD
ncbi:MAG TPA: hypothetical protein VJ725_14835, partial [Thermoanaerobaculia bacterium]|nr:hypothetical protein [Thermoanaerobaculia bacterium]